MHSRDVHGLLAYEQSCDGFYLAPCRRSLEHVAHALPLGLHKRVCVVGYRSGRHLGLLPIIRAGLSWVLTIVQMLRCFPRKQHRDAITHSRRVVRDVHQRLDWWGALYWVMANDTHAVERTSQADTDHAMARF